MAQSSIFWTTGATGDGATAYTQAQCILWLHKTFCGADNEGVSKDIDNELATTGTSSPVATNTGEAYVRGFPYFNSASVDTAIPTPSGNTRIDRLVLRASWSAQTVRITRIAGTEGSGTPPAMTQTDGTTWDIPLYQASITTGGVITLTDEREFLHPNIAVDGDMLDDDAVDSQHYTDGSIDTVHVGDAQVTLAKMADNSVDSDQYVDSSIDRVHLAADIVDGTKIENDAIDSEHYADGSIDTAHLADAQVTLAKMAADSVDDTKAGNRVPQFYRRQGGSATDWDTAGTTGYTPTAVRMQAGCVEWTGAAAASGSATVTFPAAFSYPPLPFAQTRISAISDENKVVLLIQSPVTTTGFIIGWRNVEDATTFTSLKFHWLAIGPE